MISKVSIFSIICLFFLWNQPLTSQTTQSVASDEVIELYNPSFEDMPRPSRQPRGWTDCGFPRESPPDTQPDTTFKVTKPALDGNTYLGMVTRDNDTWEVVTQRLRRPMEGNKCYAFSIYLARSENYVSKSNTTQKYENYNTPCILRIWGGASICSKNELLGETSVVTHNRWLEYNFKFEPKNTHSYIVLEVTYQMPVLFPTNGNMLLDKASPIRLVPCNEDVPLPTSPPLAEAQTENELGINPSKVNPPKLQSVVSKPANPSVNNTTQSNTASNPKSPSITKPTPEAKPIEEKIISELDKSKIQKGQIIRIKNLYFDADAFTLKHNSYAVLDEIFRFLRENPEVVVEIGGHTNGMPEHEFCDWLSSERAKTVAAYLKDKGINQYRLQYKGYGKRKPIATNKTSVGRKKNQRVEIKILSLDG